MTILKGLAPILPNQPRVLVLGSMPSARSLAERQYYAHPQNIFWRVLMELLGESPAPTDYQSRVAAARRANVAVWDVLASCRREGSLDSAICRRSESANDIAGLLKKKPSIAAVALNGGKAHECFRRHIHAQHLPTMLLLPSTSPANARMNYSQKMTAWRQMLPFLRLD